MVLLLADVGARLMLGLHLARSGKRYGKCAAEDLQHLVMEAPIKETQSDVWLDEGTRVNF